MTSPCAACKFLRRKCTNECVFAPYFPATDPAKFAYVHRIFGASNVGKILNELPVHERADAVISLFYEAESRVQDPVFGCVGFICLLQQRLKHVKQRLAAARTELAAYQGTPSQHFMNSQMLETPHGQSLVIREPNQQLQLQPHQLRVSDTQRMSSMLMHRGDQAGYQGLDMNNGMVRARGFNQTNISGGGTQSAPPPLALGSFDGSGNPDRPGQSQQLIQTDLMLQPPVLQEQPETQWQMIMQQQQQQQPQV